MSSFEKDNRSISRKNVVPGIVILTILVLIPISAFAEVDYYTYGGFGPVSSAFQRVALLFGANGYKTFIAAMGILSVVFAGIGLYAKSLVGKPQTGLSLIAPVLMGGMIYAGFFVPKESVHIYDPVLNQNLTVGDVPMGVSRTSYVLNLIEKFAVDLLDNNPSAIGEPRYQDVGVVGFNTLGATAAATIGGAALSQTISTYITDCAVFEMSRTDGTLTADDLMCTPSGSSFIAILGNASNPAVYTMEYLDGTSGTAKDCATVYNMIQTYIDNPVNAASGIASACQSEGFTDIGQCQTVVGNILMSLGPVMGASTNMPSFIGNNVAAYVTTEALMNGSASTAAQFSVLKGEAEKGMSVGVTSSIINPRMINAYIAYALVLTPILVLFLVTPMAQKVIMLIISMYSWNLIARIVDVLTYHNWAADFIQHAPTMKCTTAAGAVGGAGGEFAISFLPFMNSHLGSLGDLRSSAFLLATAISGALFKFGDSALSRLADRADANYKKQQEGFADKRHAHQEAEATQRAAWKAALADGTSISNVARAREYTEQSSAAVNNAMAASWGGSIKGSNAGASLTGRNTAERAAGANLAMGSDQAYAGGITMTKEEAGKLGVLGKNGEKAKELAAFATASKIGDMAGEKRALASIMGKKEGDITDKDVSSFHQFVSGFQTAKHNGDIKGQREGAAAMLGKNVNDLTDAEFSGIQQAVSAFEKVKGATIAGETQRAAEAVTGEKGLGAVKKGFDLTTGKEEGARFQAAKVATEKVGGGDPIVAGIAGGSVAGTKESADVNERKDRLEDTANEYSLNAAKGMKQAEYDLSRGDGTTEGTAAAVAGANAPAMATSTKFGVMDIKKRMDAEGNVVGQEIVAGQVTGDANKRELAKMFRASSQESQAREVEKLLESGKGFNDAGLVLSADGKRIISGGVASGGSNTITDRGTTARGNNQEINNSFKDDGSHTVNRDSTYSEVNKFEKRKVKNTRDEFSAGSATVDGDTILHNNTTNTQSGEFVKIMKKDGTLEEGGGITNPHTGKFELTNGVRQRKITEERVEDTKDDKGRVTGQMLVKREGDQNMGSVAVTATSAKKVDTSQTSTSGTSVRNITNEGGVFAGGFRDNQNVLDPGATAQNVAATRQGLAVGTQLVGEVVGAGAVARQGSDLLGGGGYSLRSPRTATTSTSTNMATGQTTTTTTRGWQSPLVRTPASPASGTPSPVSSAVYNAPPSQSTSNGGAMLGMVPLTTMVSRGGGGENNAPSSSMGVAQPQQAQTVPSATRADTHPKPESQIAQLQTAGHQGGAQPVKQSQQTQTVVPNQGAPRHSPQPGGGHAGKHKPSTGGGKGAPVKPNS